MDPARSASPMLSHAAAVVRVGVGSANAAKVAAVRTVFRRLRVPYRLVICPTTSGVSDQPMSEAETVQGAFNRARHVLATTDVDLAIAFEGGIDQTLFGTFAVEWCAVHDRNGTQGVGGGPKVELPDWLSARVRDGEPLGIAIQHAGFRGTSARAGVFGLLTRNLVTRESANRAALLVALARFLQAPIYHDERPSEESALLAERLVAHFSTGPERIRPGDQLSLHFN